MTGALAAPCTGFPFIRGRTRTRPLSGGSSSHPLYQVICLLLTSGSFPQLLIPDFDQSILVPGTALTTFIYYQNIVFVSSVLNHSILVAAFMILESDNDPKGRGLIPRSFKTNIVSLCPVLRIRIYYYADPDPGSKKCPYGSGCGCGSES